VKDELRRAVDTIPGLVWSALPDGTMDFLNQRWCDYTGISLGEASGVGWQAACHPEDLPRLIDFWRSLLDTSRPGEFEARLRRYDGTFRWFLIRAVPLCDEGGRVLKWYGQNTDIEDRRQAEALLAGEKRLLEMVAVGRPLPAILDALCTLVDQVGSGCHCSILLVDRGGAQVRQAAAPSLPADFSRAIDGRPVAAPYWGPCAMAIDRKTQVIVADVAEDTRWDRFEWCELVLGVGLRSCWTTPILSQAGAPLGTFAIYQREPGAPTPTQLDLIEQFTHLASIAVERAHAEDALRRSQAQLARAQRLSTTGSFSYRAATDDLTLSEETCRICGFDPLMPVPPGAMRDRIHPDDLPLFLGMLRGLGKQFEFDCRVQLPDGTIKYLQVVADAVRDDAGHLVEWVGAIRDITERKLSEDALHEMRSELAHVTRVASLGALTASIAHEVNQPLSGIVTNASTSLRMLADDPPNVEGARETARRTIRDANRAADVVGRLRALFKKKNRSVECLDLNDATREVLTLLSTEIHRAKATVRTHLSEDLPLVTGDRVQLQQVVLNLMLNALEAMDTVEDRPRQLVIRTECDEGEQVRLTVEDSGPGFDPKNAEKLFDTFYTTKDEGMGIGLSISRSIVENHQGRLWAVCNDGPGATFGFSIPGARA